MNLNALALEEFFSLLGTPKSTYFFDIISQEKNLFANLESCVGGRRLTRGKQI